MSTVVSNEPTKIESVVMTACNSHCGGMCLLKVHLKDGVITRIEADDGEEPQLRGCLRGRAYRQRVYAPDRLKYPMKRVGARGAGKFERISWDEALDTVAGELKRVKEAYGPSAILLWVGGGDAAFFNSGALGARLFQMFGGHSAPWGLPSFEGANFASTVNYGTFFNIGLGNTRDDLLSSRLIVMWGWNPAATIQGTNTCWYLAQAREAGARIVAIDPRFTDTVVTFADQWIPIRPSTDIAMLIAMAYVIIKENLQDQRFIDKYTIGFEQFENYVLGLEDGIPKTPAWAEAITGVHAAIIEKLARDYATMKPAALIAGIGPGRTANGEQYHRAAITLAAMTGNIGIHGGYPAAAPAGTVAPWNMYPHRMKVRIAVGPNPVIDSAPPPKIVLHGQRGMSSALVHHTKLADAILKGKAGGYPADYKLLFVMLTNPVNQFPNSNKVAQALQKLEFIVVHEQFMTATARYADILLPMTTALERADVSAGGGSTPFYGSMNKVIEPLYESKPYLQVFTELAARLGLPAFSDKTEDEWLEEMAKSSPDIPDYVAFKKEGGVKVKLQEPYVAFRKQIENPQDNPFPTLSGKIEIYSQQLADLNDPLLPPIPKYIPTWETPSDPLVQKYPLQLISTHFRNRAHSQFETMPWLRELETQALWINSVDAEARKIRDGDPVTVFNDRGRVVVPAKVTERIMPGVVDLPEGAWYNPDETGVDRGGCPNTLTKDEPSPGGAYAYNTCLVQVEKA